MNEKGVKTVILVPESSDTEIEDACEGKDKVLVFTKSVGVKWVFNTDREFKAVSWILQNEKGNVQYYFQV